MRVGVVGGIPPFMGGGGLEVQLRETSAALRNLGADISDWRSSAGDRVDVVHLFGADPSTWNYLKNWTTRHTPIVVSPISVFDSRFQNVLEKWTSKLRVGMSTSSNMRRDVVESADHLVALHADEAGWLSRCYGIPPAKITILANGSSATATPAIKPVGANAYACVGTVGDRKQQLELARNWTSELPDLVFAGDVEANWASADSFAREVETRANVHWLGRLSQQDTWNLQSAALATISYSKSEGESLALVDSLRLGRPVIVKQSASALALGARYGSAVQTVRPDVGLTDQLIPLSRQLKQGAVEVKLTPPAWSEIAGSLLAIYADLVQKQ